MMSTISEEDSGISMLDIESTPLKTDEDETCLPIKFKHGNSELKSDDV
jgi:hypothetical protein